LGAILAVFLATTRFNRDQAAHLDFRRGVVLTMDLMRLRKEIKEGEVMKRL
jgi:hypothetical protein